MPVVQPEMPPHSGPAIAIEPGKTYRLRDMRTKMYCIGTLEDGENMVCSVNGSYKNYWRSGKLAGSGSSKRPDDAILEWRELVRVQIYGYQNVYSDHTRSEMFETRDIANSNVDPNKTRIACINMEREVIEGEGLYD